MVLKLLNLLIIFLCGSVWAILGDPDELPVGNPMKVQQQEDLYVAAYESLGPIQVHGRKTHIEGLAPLICNQFMYVSTVLHKGEEAPGILQSKADLRALWGACCVHLKDQPLSLSFLNDTAVYLAHILDGRRLEEPNFSVQKLAGLGERDWYGWQDHLQSNVFLTFMTSNTGGFSYDRFVQGYLKHDFMLLHNPLTYAGCATVHGGVYEGSAMDFLEHDLAHNRQTVATFYSQQVQFERGRNVPSGFNYWQEMRKIYRHIYAKKGPEAPKNIFALFLQLHEFVQPFDSDAFFSVPFPYHTLIQHRLLYAKISNTVQQLQDSCYQPVVAPGILIQSYFRGHVVAFSPKTKGQANISLRIDVILRELDKRKILCFVDALLSSERGRCHDFFVTGYFDSDHQAFVRAFRDYSGCGLMTKGLAKCYEIAQSFLQSMYLYSEDDAQFSYDNEVLDEERGLRGLPGNRLPSTEELPVHKRCELYTQWMTNFWQDFLERNTAFFQ